MLEREPHCSELQQAGSFRIEHAAGNVDVCYGIAIEEHVAALKVEQECQNRDGCRQPCQQRNIGSAWGGRFVLGRFGHRICGEPQVSVSHLSAKGRSGVRKKTTTRAKALSEHTLYAAPN